MTHSTFFCDVFRWFTGKKKKKKGKKKKKKEPKKADSQIARELEEAARLLDEEKQKDKEAYLWIAYLKEIDDLLRNAIVGKIK